MKQPAFTGHWYAPEQLGYVRIPAKCTAKVEVYRAPDGKIREWDAEKGRPLVFVDDNAGIR